MRITSGGRFILIFLVALLAIAAAAPGSVHAESNGSGGTPFPYEGAPLVDSYTSSTGLSAAELFSLYLSIL